DAISKAAHLGDRRIEAYAQLELALQRLQTRPEGQKEDLRDLAVASIDLFQRLADPSGLARAWVALAVVYQTECRIADRQDAVEHALVHASRAAEGFRERSILRRLDEGLWVGPTPVAEGL